MAESYTLAMFLLDWFSSNELTGLIRPASGGPDISTYQTRWTAVTRIPDACLVDRQLTIWQAVGVY